MTTSSWGDGIITKEAIREQNNEGKIHLDTNQWIFICQALCLPLADTVRSKRDLVPDMI